MSEKKCKKCGVVKDFNEFYKNKRNKDGIITSCKECEGKRARKWGDTHKERKLALAKEWVKNNKDKLASYDKKWATNNPDKVKERWLKQCYGITLAQYKQLAENQFNKCAICEKVSDKLFVDHDHNDGRIRGLLCRECNTGIGFLQDSPYILGRAIEYLK